MKISRLFIILWLGLILTSCKPWSRVEQADQSLDIHFKEGQSLGQTFVAAYDGLSGVGLALKSVEPGEGTLKLTIRPAPGDSEILRESVISRSEINPGGDTVFYFPPIANSGQEDYYFSLRMDGSGVLGLGAASGATYLDGALYSESEPVNAQLAFNLTYGRRMLLGGLLQEGLVWLLWSAAGLWLFVIPGWALLSWLYPTWNALDFWGKFGLSSGLSLAIYPLFMLWTNVVGLHLGAIYAWLPPLAGALFILYRNRHLHAARNLHAPRIRSINWPGLAVLILVSLVALTRFWVIRSLEVPLWGDSYQHTVMAQLIVDHRGLFTSWMPYAELQSFTYHFGFHSLAAVFHWLTHLSLPQSILWTGQILNVLAVAAVYPLALRITKNPWAGVFAVLFAGLAFSMPMFYLNWGRYTQLAGLIVLPAFVLAAWELLDSQVFDWRLATLGWISLAGLALIHVRVLIFALVFLAAYYMLYFQPKRWLSRLLAIIGLCFGGLILALPWMINIGSGKYIPILMHQITTPAAQLTSSETQAFAIGNIFDYLPAWAWLLLPIVIGWALWRREKGFTLICLWWFLILLAANPQWLNAPGAGVITSFAVMIAAYFPASILLGAAAGWVIEAIQARTMSISAARPASAWLRQNGLPLALFGLVLCAGLLGAPARINDIQISQHALASRADLRAAAWIKENTPPQAGFLANAFFAYGGYAIVGSDGGWWLPLTANRRASVPPLPYASEQGIQPGYRERVNSLVQMIQDKGINDPQVLSELAARGLGYLYIGQQQGRVNSSDPLIKLEEVLSNPKFKPIYHQDRVWIFEIEQNQ